MKNRRIFVFYFIFCSVTEGERWLLNYDGSCSIYVICVCLHIVVSNTSCIVLCFCFVCLRLVCPIFCRFLWIAIFLLPFRYYLTFICWFGGIVNHHCLSFLFIVNWNLIPCILYLSIIICTDWSLDLIWTTVSPQAHINRYHRKINHICGVMVTVLHSCLQCSRSWVGIMVKAIVFHFSHVRTKLYI